ncbi:MAG: hypothetical protein HGA22_09890 [Clostridiales bacterium]|nr:hypothetical protein [Clostridiales bacterium]
MFKKGRAELNAHLLQDLKPVFTTIDDLAVIADYKGVITEVNYPEKLEALAGHGCETIEGLLSALNCKSTGTFLSMNDITLPGLAAREVVEIYFPESDEYFLFGGAAVMAGTSRLGTSIVMHDITERKKSEQRIIKRNRYLEEANLKLSNYVRIANILEAEKERVKLLEQLQAELINMIENAIDHVHALQNQTYNEITSYHKDIGIFADLLRDIYKQVRKSIRRISGEEGR